MKFSGFILLAMVFSREVVAQTPWPSTAWNAATNLTDVMDENGINELSGLFWNPVQNRLFAVQNDGRIRVLARNQVTGAFSQWGNKTVVGGPEGITQVNYADNQFYVIDEDNYQIRKYSYTSTFSSVTLSKHWDLLAAPSPMEDTGNTGPEGIAFIPDSALADAGFTSSVTGQLYTSTKGAGGLFFIAHQNGGYLWAFDINPNTSNDFAYVGKYRTSRAESCEVTFDRSTGLLYILHNIDDNYLQVCTLAPAPAIEGEATLTTVAEYFLPTPNDENVNIEGFALSPKCPGGTTEAWLCRDVEAGEDAAVRQDALRYFSDFEAPGTCALSKEDFEAPEVNLSPNPVHDMLSLSFAGRARRSVKIFDQTGKAIYQNNSENSDIQIVTSGLPAGFYMLEVADTKNTSHLKFIKN